MTETNPPELYWSESLSEEADRIVVAAGEAGDRRYFAPYLAGPPVDQPGDAVRLVPQTEVDTQRALTGGWQRQYAEMKQRAVEAEDQRGVAWQQLKAILALFDADSDCMEPGDTAEFVREQLARLREHAIQLPEIAHLIEKWAHTRELKTDFDRGYRSGMLDIVDALRLRHERGVESWRTATHPTPQVGAATGISAPETSEPREENPGD